MSYDQFIAAKLGTIASAGIDAPLRDYALFPHQRDLTKWALRRGKSAIFADTGLGKMRMAIAWADTVVAHTGLPVMILCPLAVAQQFVAEGLLMGIEVTHCREQQAADEMYAQMSADTFDAVRESVLGARKNTNDYNASRRVAVPSFLVAA